MPLKPPRGHQCTPKRCNFRDRFHTALRNNPTRRRFNYTWETDLDLLLGFHFQKLPSDAVQQRLWGEPQRFIRGETFRPARDEFEARLLRAYNKRIATYAAIAAAQRAEQEEVNAQVQLAAELESQRDIFSATSERWGFSTLAHLNRLERLALRPRANQR